MFLASTEAQRPWRWMFLAETPELAAKVAPPDLDEWVLNLDMSDTISEKDFLKESLYAE